MRTKPIVFLEGKRLYLRPLCIADVPVIQRYVNDPDVRRYLANVFPVSEQDEEQWVKKVMQRDETNIVLAVVLKKRHKLLGCMGFHRINYVDGTAYTGAMLGAKEEWNKGYGQEAKMLLLEYAFLTLNLRKICSTATAPNKGSILHNTKCGYKIEGYLKKQTYCDGKYYDHVLLAVFKQDWLKVKK